MKHARMITRTYRLRPETVQRIDALSTALHLYQSPLMDALLTEVLDAIDAGRLKICTKPVKWEFDRLEKNG